LRFTLETVDSDTIISKGSITIEGVSLTIAEVSDTWFEVVLVPTTINETTLGTVAVGDFVNIETDILTRTIVQVARNMNKK
jgi:riboflavin synthase alpha subunit